MNISIVGNWKSNGSLELNKSWIQDFQSVISISALPLTAICPPHIYLDQMTSISKDIDISIGSQDIDASNGARTGSISADACIDIGCNFSLIGHSERRQLFHENNTDIKKKLITAQAQDLDIILCIGEPEDQYISGTTREYLRTQILECIQNINLSESFAIAYEPIWAIGTGKLPKTEEINAIHKYIKDIVQSATQNNITPKVFYGGSVTNKNAADLFKEDYIDGALIGGASLNGKEFAEIANIFINRGK